MSEEVIRVRPFHYLHIKNQNTNVIRLEIGPKTLTLMLHEKVVLGPEKMIVIPPCHYVVVSDPVVRKRVIDQKTKQEVSIVVMDEYGQAQFHHGGKEIRFAQQPFPLYAGEKCSPVKELTVVENNTALRLKAIRDFKDADGNLREVGSEWLFSGPDTYYPQVEVEVVSVVKAIILKPNQALKLSAKEDCVDIEGNKRKAGQEWLVQREGPYLPNVNEIVVETINAYILTDTEALHVKAKSTFKNTRGEIKKAGTEWLVTNEEYGDTYTPDVHEEVLNKVKLIILNDKEFCTVKDPVDEKTGIPQLGTFKQVRGPTAFFLKPGETLSGNIRNSILLSNDEALLLTCNEEFQDNFKVCVKRKPRCEWYSYGPGEYWPPVEVVVKSKVKAFLVVSPLNLCYFQPSLFMGSFLLLLLLLFFFLKNISSIFG